MFGAMTIVCPSPCYHDRAWLSWAWLSTSLPMGSGELIPWFALPVCAAAHKSLFWCLLWGSKRSR